MFTWRSYLEDTNGQAAPKENFLHFHKPPKSSELNGWKIGLKLEAVDRSNTSLICVATVTNVMDGRVLIHFDGWDLEYDYWVTPSSPYIHPKGTFLRLCKGVTKYEIVVGHTLNLFLESGGVICYQNTKKWWGMCPQAQPMVTPLCLASWTQEF